MALVLCKVIGDGSPDNPRRVQLPTYVVRAEHPALPLWVCEVPEGDVPKGCPTRRVVLPTVPPQTFVCCILAASVQDDWAALIRRRYADGNAAWDPAAAVSP